MIRQQTLQHVITTRGVGLHSGNMVTVTLRPASAGQGIVFRRTDLSPVVEIPAKATNVVDTRLATVLGAHGQTLSTVEHLLAALWAAGIDNAIVDVDGPEVPVMDGSSAPWVELIEHAGTVAQEKVRMVGVIRREVVVTDGDKRASVSPSDGFSVQCEVAYNHPSIQSQQLEVRLDGGTFRREFARARTFGFLWEVEALRKMGLARGGSLENAVVLDESGIMNPEGLRFPDEFVRHKVLDAVGDLFLLGGALIGRLELTKGGHALHNKLCKAILETPGAIEWIPAVDTSTPVRQRTGKVARIQSQPPPAQVA